MVQAYWEIGRLIVEHEQSGHERAEYGRSVLESLSVRLIEEFGKGFDETNLRKMRQFYLVFSNRDALRLKSGEAPNQEAVQAQSNVPPAYLRSELIWTHYRMLMRVENEIARNWYMNEAADQQWSTRQLERWCSFTLTFALPVPSYTLRMSSCLVSRSKIATNRSAALY